MRVSQRWAWSVMIALLLVVMACGSNDSDETSADSKLSDVDSAQPQGSDSDESGADATDGSNQGSSGDFCEAAQTGMRILGSEGGELKTGDAQKAIDALGVMVESLPDELADTQGSFSAMEDYLGFAVDLADQLGIPTEVLSGGELDSELQAQIGAKLAQDPDLMKKFQEFGSKVSGIDFLAIGSDIARLEEYVGANCG